MATLHLLLVILALGCFLFAALEIMIQRRQPFLAAGLLLWLLSTLVGR